MVSTIVFSKDKAIKLNLLLDSIFKNSKNLFNVHVLYEHSNNDFRSSYNNLIDLYSDKNVKWTNVEGDFRETLLNLVKEAKEKYTCFFTDDDVLYKSIDDNSFLDVLEKDKNSFCFSTRLGLNVKKCYTMGSDNVIRPEYNDGKIMFWDWKVHYLDFGFPLSIHGHIFRTKEIYKLSKKVDFTNPEELESSLQMFDTFPKSKMYSFVDSVSVNLPINLTVNEDNYSNEEYLNSINEDYLENKKMDLETIDFSEINACYKHLNINIE
jgi:hypothetical protein